MPARPLRALALALVLGLLASSGSRAAPIFDGLFLFGDSLADNGNAFLALGPTEITPVPVAGNTFIPSKPYLRGPGLLPAFSNGPVWGELLAQQLGLPPPVPANPFLPGGNNFAFGGARMTPTPDPTDSPSIREQVALFDSIFDLTPAPDAPGNALYVVWGGGNDARDAAGVAQGGGDPSGIITDYGSNLFDSISTLVEEGARNILVVNTPDISLTPFVQTIGLLDPGAIPGAAALSAAFNDVYDQTMDTLDALLGATPGLDLRRFDVAGLLQSIAADPAAFGLTNAGDACAADPACIADSSGHLFWDGIHVTDSGHRILAGQFFAAVPAPATLALAGVLLLVPRRRSPPVAESAR